MGAMIKPVTIQCHLTITMAALFCSCATFPHSTRAMENDLINACERGHVTRVQLLLDKGVDPEAPRIGVINQPMLYAIVNNHIVVVDILLKAGISPNFDWHGKRGTFLTNAAQYGHDGIVTLLIEAEADVNLKRDGHSALYRAVINSNKSTVTLLLNHGANLSDADRHAFQEMKATGATNTMIDQLMAQE